MERINFNHLYYFYVVAKEGSIKEAATKLHLSQPTISDQIKLLEDFLKTPLFERRNRALFLTKQGQIALDYAGEVFNLGDELTRRLRNNIKLPKKSIDIGISYNLSPYFLYETLSPLFKKSDLTVNIVENHHHLLLAELEIENIDLVFTGSHESSSSHLELYKVGINKTYAIAHRSLSQKSKKKFPELLNELPYFGHSQQSQLKFAIELYFKTHKLSPRLIGQADDIDLFEFITNKAYAFTIVPEVGKNRICANNNIEVLGEIDELKTPVWAFAKNNTKELTHSFLNQLSQKVAQ